MMMQKARRITKTDERSSRMSATSLSALWSRAGRSARYLDGFLRHRGLLRSRTALLRLDDHLLRDIGLTRTEAETEALRREWDAPASWRV
jgi:uncharacterized protein YjiS (DUF1127 family)